jgi:hypothetical protein
MVVVADCKSVMSVGVVGPSVVSTAVIPARQPVRRSRQIQKPEK